MHGGYDMPGINMVLWENMDKISVLKNLEKLKHEPNFNIKKIVETNDFLLAFSGYNKYPRQHYSDEEVTIFLEGIVYNSTDIEIEKSLKSISKAYLEKRDYKEKIKQFVDVSDGVFITIIYFHKLGEFILFNDYWGCIPLFYYKDERMIIVSREIKFILDFIPVIEFDRISIVEFLVFEYQLGNKTLFKKIHRVPPSSLLSSKRVNSPIERLFDLKFGKSSKKISDDEYILKAKELFLRSTLKRLNKIKEKGYKSTVDISGGYDSRAVVAGICHFGKKPNLNTVDLITGNESHIAKQVANIFELEIHEIHADHSMHLSDMKKVIYKTDCMVNVWTALSCYNDKTELHNKLRGVSVEFTGFGGEFLRHPLKPKGYFKTIVDVVKDRGSDIKNACLAVNLDESDYYEYIRVYFNKEYSEPSLEGKIKHFYWEYRNHLPAAGEDRHRLHFWTVNPLLSKDLLLLYTKEIPLNMVGYEFFRKFLFSIDPRVTTIPIYGGEPSDRRLFQFLLDRKLFSKILRIRHSMKLKRLAKRNIEERKNITDKILETFNESEYIPLYFSEKGVKDFIKKPDLMSKWRLLTLFLYIREIEFRHKLKLKIAKINGEVK